MTNSLDSLAKIASGLGLSVNELAAELALAPAVVQSWIDGTSRPGEETRHALQLRVIAKKAQFEKGRVALHRINTLHQLAIALQTPTQRKAWLKKRAEIRARYVYDRYAR